MTLHSFYGGSAISDFRAARLLEQTQRISPYVGSLIARYVYFITASEPLSTLEENRLIELLQAQVYFLPHFSDRLHHLPLGFDVFVAPRLGTISPWSSKAIDILHHCGLQSVNRIERTVLYNIEFQSNLDRHRLADEINLDSLKRAIASPLHDPMTESLLFDQHQVEQLFMQPPPKPLQTIDILERGLPALEQANESLGLALSQAELAHLHTSFQKLKRNPTDVELMMFAQANSEHCRHKIFNAEWEIDEITQPFSLFQMIRHTHEQNPQGVLSAYHDNGAVLAQNTAERLWIDPITHTYRFVTEEQPIVIKVETHNHPTAISPFSGAATGSGGEIRDEGSVGRGAKPKAGLTGFSVSHLNIPELPQPWEIHYGKPAHLASALDIMLEAPLGAAAFNNEFGRPGICGYFRTYEMHIKNTHGAVRGYHKPIMLAGGLGNIRPQHIEKHPLPPNALLIVIGGPAMLIGMGGGAASSVQAGSQQATLDFASVQRSNPEIQRRCQELIDACCALDDQNPILAIHDVGAGGLSNAIPEILHGSARGGIIHLRTIPSADTHLSPMEIWCNEAQERYVLSIQADDLTRFTELAERERCPFAVIGQVEKKEQLLVKDKTFENQPIDIPMSLLFGSLPKQQRAIKRHFCEPNVLDISAITLQEAARRVLQLPCVADKSFLITIGDRTVGGMVARDQMVGPWQTPVADVAVTANSFNGYAGEAMAMGERAPIALAHPAASALMAVGEAITNLAAAAIADISCIKLSANWMAAAGYPGEEAGLYEAVRAVALELCPALGICIPVGKDSLSMRTVWQEHGEERSVTAPLSLVVSAFAPVTDIRKTLTPVLNLQVGETDLILIDLGEGCNALGGSALAQVYQQTGSIVPDIDNPEALKAFFSAIQTLNQTDLLLAYHDRSDGGLFVTLCEMAFASHCGLSIALDGLGQSALEILFSEELGAVIQVKRADTAKTLALLDQYPALNGHYRVIGHPEPTDTLTFHYQQAAVLTGSRVEWQRLWSSTSYHMQTLRDNPECAQQAYDQILDAKDPGLQVKLTFNPADDIAAPYIASGVRPQIAILREQGVNSHYEMAAAFEKVGFEPIDVHMTDILAGRTSLKSFAGLAVGGGFSYGDVLGAGRGWASSILYHARARAEFSAFFERSDTFTLGVCNGCQMLVHLKTIIPGAEHWPVFVRNRSEQFEARLSLVEIQPSPSLFFTGMVGSQFCVASSHGEGRAIFTDPQAMSGLLEADLAPVRYIDHYGQITENYPDNPNGSPAGIAGLTTKDGRVTLMMPHPERVFRTVQNAWHPADWGEEGPTLRLFRNAREWIG